MASLDSLKQKYQSVLNLVREKGVSLKHLHMEGDKMYMQGFAPNDDIKNAIWDQIKVVDAAFADLTCDLSIDSTLPIPVRTHTIAKGESLWKISEHYYGNGAHYKKILEANKETIENENKIYPGDVLVIPD
jgi:hypothetical protein